MIELSIHFTSEEKDEASAIRVKLFRPDTGVWTEPAAFEVPLGEKELDDLAWYLEVFSTWPTGPDYERAERIESQLEAWGRALLASATPDRESAQLWQQFCDADGEGKLRRVVAGERAAAALLAGLDPTDRVILGAVLAGLGADGGGPAPERQGVTVEGLIDLVGQACG